jgi:hypothetical protein
VILLGMGGISFLFVLLHLEHRDRFHDHGVERTRRLDQEHHLVVVELEEHASDFAGELRFDSLDEWEEVMSQHLLHLFRPGVS